MASLTGTFVSMYAAGQGSTFISSPVTGMKASAIAVPINITSATLDSAFRPTVEFNYTGVGHTGYNIQLEKVDGTPISAKLPATITLLSANKLRAVSPVTFSAEYVGNNVVMALFEVINGQESVLPSRTTFFVPAPMTFTVNPVGSIYYYSVDPFSNKFSAEWRIPGTDNSYRGPENASPQIGYNGDLLEDADTVGRELQWRWSNQGLSGTRWRYILEGAVSSMRVAGGLGMTDVTPMQTSGADTFIDFTINYDYAAFINRSGLNDASFFRVFHTPSGTGATWPKNHRMYQIDANGNRVHPGKFDGRYIAEHQRFNQYPFGLRFLDWFNTSGNSYTVFSRPSQAGDIAGSGKHSFVDALDYLTATGNTGKLQLPMQGTESYIRTEARRCAVWAKNAQKKISLRLSNEVWNSAQGSWNVSIIKGKEAIAAGIYPEQSDKSNNGYAMRYWAFRNKQVMTWVTEEFAAEGSLPWLNRVMETQNGGLGNFDAYVTAEPGHLDYIDGFETAPYVGGGRGSGLTADEAGLTELYSRLRADWPAIFASSAAWRNKARSLNKTFGNYEGMFEDFRGGKALWIAFNADPRTYDLVTDMLNDYERIVGGQMSLYNDVRADAYGYRLNIDQPLTATMAGVPVGQIGRAVFDKMAQLASA